MRIELAEGARILRDGLRNSNAVLCGVGLSSEISYQVDRPAPRKADAPGPAGPGRRVGCTVRGDRQVSAETVVEVVTTTSVLVRRHAKVFTSALGTYTSTGEVLYDRQ